MDTPIIRNVAILAALVIALALSACSKSKNEASTDAAKSAAKPAQTAAPAGGPPPGMPVKAEAVKLIRVSDEISAVGSLMAEESVIIRPEIDGRIVGMHFQEGHGVTAGSRLFTIDSTEYEAQLAAVTADLRTEQQRLSRTQELYDQKFVSKDALDAQIGNVARLQARVEEVQSRVAKTIIRAPFSGTLGLRQVSPGAYVKAGNDLVRLESVGSLKVDFRIPENYLSKIRSDQDIIVRLDAYPGEEFKGRVYAVEPVVDEKTRTIQMRARIPNKGLRLKPGMFVRVGLTLGVRPNAIVVREEAIWPQGRDAFVFRVVEGKAVLTKIQVGNRQPGQVEVLSGLSPNDVVVTEGQMKLRDGAPVTVMAPPAAPGPAGAPAAQEQKKAG